MATIKSYTDISQSKKLAKILPLESADMGWYYPCNPNSARNQMWLGTKSENADIPCWSLASLLGVLPEKYTELIKEGGMYRIIIKDSYMTCLFDNPVDACCELIVKLHELKVL